MCNNLCLSYLLILAKCHGCSSADGRLGTGRQQQVAASSLHQGLAFHTARGQKGTLFTL